MGNRKYTQAELSRTHQQVEVKLRKIPGIVGVGFGIKEKAGELTKELGFRVYVIEKKKEKDLLQNELIPKQMMGFKTDVLKIPEAVFTGACEDNNKVRPIVGGITISNLKNPPDNPLAYEHGTLGYFAQINGDRSRDNIVMLTNMHVVSKNGGKKGDPIYQPKTPVDFSIERANGRIGEVLNAFPINNYSFQYPNETINPVPQYYLDCASVKVDTDYSTCCNTNKGIDFKKEINNLNINGSNQVIGIARLQHSDIIDANGIPIPYTVYKVGRQSAKTTGTIVDINTPNVRLEGIMAKNVISIRATENNCDGVLKFTEVGDSGAVLVNAKNEIIGLLCAMNPAAPFESYACHIHPVIENLKITMLSTPIASSSDKRNIPVQLPNIIETTTFLSREEELSKLENIKSAILQAEEGPMMYNIFEKHRPEIAALINHYRPVTVVWHRNNGPSFVAHFVKSFHEPSYYVPSNIKGITLPVFLKNIAGILHLHGSPALKKIIEQYIENIIDGAANCNSLEALLTNICNYKPDEQLTGNN
ncbi:MAG: hypothetical protein M3R36_03990 [Bacteroidota bacterium]|nr:hypothetical protein [Bacteroidota bacterium]